MMFRFNFQSDGDDDRANITGNQQDLFEKPCEEITLSDSASEYVFQPVRVDTVELFIRDLDKEDYGADKAFLKSYRNCDVVPSIYEGGLKVWECTYDLLSFFLRNDVTFENKTVLDLGCGCGLLGIFAGIKGAKTVHFQDYNVDVLRGFTLPNVQRNRLKCATRFFSGDWKNFNNSSCVGSFQYDCILTSETLYSANNYPKLCELFSRRAKSRGEIYVASKSYYFGVGGSVQQFQECLNKYEDLNWETIWKNESGVQREILRVTRS